MEKVPDLIQSLPLEGLWRNNRFQDYKEIRFLSTAEVKECMKQGLVKIVVCDIGYPLIWLSGTEMYHFLKNIALPHLASPTEPIVLEHFPDEFAFLASEWAAASGEKVIVFQKIH